MAEKKLFHILDLQGNKIKGVGAPVDGTDVATKASAQAQANAAQSAAETFATNAATTAKTQAIAAAELDAASKAATAKSEAVTEAALDAQTKADTALQSAKTYADTKITDLVNGAPQALNTLNELATALGSDANFSATIATSIGLKTSKFAATITGTPTPVSGDYEYLVNHNLVKADIVFQAFLGNDSVYVFVRKVDDNSLKIITGAALGSTEIRIVIVG